MSIQFDPNIFAALGITPDANSMDNPPPIADGGYQVNLTLAPIPTVKKKDGAEVSNSKIINGKEYAGQAVAPLGDLTSLTKDDQGRVEYQLYLSAEVLSPETSKVMRTIPTYVRSTKNKAGACLLMDLAVTIASAHLGAIDLVKAVAKYNTPGGENHVWRGVAEAIAELLEGNPEGVVVPAFIATKLEQATGKKKPGTEYDEMKVLAWNMAAIQKQFSTHWTGDKQPDGFRLVTEVKGFKA
jgi:hypothetical protein